MRSSWKDYFCKLLCFLALGTSRLKFLGLIKLYLCGRMLPYPNEAEEIARFLIPLIAPALETNAIKGIRKNITHDIFYYKQVMVYF